MWNVRGWKNSRNHKRPALVGSNSQSYYQGRGLGAAPASPVGTMCYCRKHHVKSLFVSAPEHAANFEELS